MGLTRGGTVCPRCGHRTWSSPRWHYCAVCDRAFDDAGREVDEDETGDE